MIARKNLDPDLQWFPEARFGMFIHFGLYALLGRGEWVMYHEDIPREEYEKLARRFNPHRFNADEWVDTAKRGGCRYITVTAKHHDGFCLFDSNLTDYNITNTPFGRGLIGELIAACQRQGMRIILYYSQPDWHHPNFVHHRGCFKDLQYERSDDTPDWPKFMDYVEGQLVELCTQYGRIDGIWFDGVQKTEKEWRGRKLYKLIKQLQPGAVVNDRAGHGDFFTPERRLSGMAGAAGYTVEACQSICRESWGYKPDGSLFSTPFLIESMVRMAAAGGNYLLNIGPKPDGTLPEDQVQRLTEIGDWLKVHGKSIYNAQGCPMIQESEDALYTRKGKRLYLHPLRWPDADAIFLKQVKSVPVRARLLGNGKTARPAMSGDELTLEGLPSLPPDRAVNVVELMFDNESMLRPLPRTAPPAVHVVTTGTKTVLPAETAVRQGFGPKGIVIELATAENGASYLTHWTHPDQTATWHVECLKPVTCEVSVEMGCQEVWAGSTFSVKAGQSTLKGVVPATGSFDDFRRVHVGEIRLPRGRSRLTLTPRRQNFGFAFASVRRIILRA